MYYCDVLKRHPVVECLLLTRDMSDDRKAALFSPANPAFICEVKSYIANPLFASCKIKMKVSTYSISMLMYSI